MNHPVARHNGISRNIYKRRSPRRLNPREINYAYVDNQILKRPPTTKQTTPSDMRDSTDALSFPFSEFEIDAYASNEDLIRRLVPINA